MAKMPPPRPAAPQLCEHGRDLVEGCDACGNFVIDPLIMGRDRQRPKANQPSIAPRPWTFDEERRIIQLAKLYCNVPSDVDEKTWKSLIASREWSAYDFDLPFDFLTGEFGRTKKSIRCKWAAIRASFNKPSSPPQVQLLAKGRTWREDVPGRIEIPPPPARGHQPPAIVVAGQAKAGLVPKAAVAAEAVPLIQLQQQVRQPPVPQRDNHRPKIIERAPLPARVPLQRRLPASSLPAQARAPPPSLSPSRSTAPRKCIDLSEETQSQASYSPSSPSSSSFILPTRRIPPLESPHHKHPRESTQNEESYRRSVSRSQTPSVSRSSVSRRKRSRRESPPPAPEAGPGVTAWEEEKIVSEERRESKSSSPRSPPLLDLIESYNSREDAVQHEDEDGRRSASRANQAYDSSEDAVREDEDGRRSARRANQAYDSSEDGVREDGRRSASREKQAANGSSEDAVREDGRRRSASREKQAFGEEESFFESTPARGEDNPFQRRGGEWGGFGNAAYPPPRIATPLRFQSSNVVPPVPASNMDASERRRNEFKAKIMYKNLWDLADIIQEDLLRHQTQMSM